MIRQLDPLVSLPATDVPRAVRFYTETLGCKAMVEHPETGFYLFQLPEGHGWLGIHRHPGPLPPSDPEGIWVWLWVKDLVTAREELTAKGIRFLGEAKPLGPGIEQPFIDTEGNVLRLYEPMNRLERSVEIAASPEEVFQALTTAAAIERWFSAIDDVEFEARAGGAVRFRDPTFGDVEGVITAWDPPRGLTVEFSQNWPRILEYRLTAEGRNTRLVVRQSEFDLIRDRDFGIPGLIEHLDQALLVLTTLAKAGGLALGAVEVARAVKDQLKGS